MSAKRVAFSAFGQIQKLDGSSIESGRVLAKCVDCDRVEETVIDENGKFRIRGLLPG